MGKTTLELREHEKHLETLIRARYPIIQIVSHEENRVMKSLDLISQALNKQLFYWTINTGLNRYSDRAMMRVKEETTDPAAALDAILRDKTEHSLYVLYDFHFYMGDPRVVRMLLDVMTTFTNQYKNVIILSPTVDIPSELSKSVAVLDWPLPDMPVLAEVLKGMDKLVEGNKDVNVEMDEKERDRLLRSLLGLTAHEAENVLAKSIVAKRCYDPDIILSEKKQIIRKSGILEFYEVQVGMEDVGGLDLLKEWGEERNDMFSHEAYLYGLPPAKGVMFIGVPGTGKSLAAKAFARQWGLPLLRFDVGKVFGGIVGKSEENIRQVLKTAESIAPCLTGDSEVVTADGRIVTIDEIWHESDTQFDLVSMSEGLDVRRVPIKAITRKPSDDVYSVRTMLRVIRATGNHRFPVLRNGRVVWLEVQDLQPGDRVAASTAIPTEEMKSWVEVLPSDARVYDGSVSASHRNSVRDLKDRRRRDRTPSAFQIPFPQTAQESMQHPNP
jgi:hypothetical protein